MTKGLESAHLASWMDGDRLMSSAPAWDRWARPPAPIIMMLPCDPWCESLANTTELPLRSREELIQMSPKLASLHTTESAVLESCLILVVAVFLLILSNPARNERLRHASDGLWWERRVICGWEDAWEGELPAVVKFVGSEAEHCAVKRVEASHYAEMKLGWEVLDWRAAGVVGCDCGWCWCGALNEGSGIVAGEKVLLKSKSGGVCYECFAGHCDGYD